MRTKDPAPSGTERHPAQGLDQGPDHETKGAFGLGRIAEELLEAVGEGSLASVRLARMLAEAVLNVPLVKRALLVEQLLQEGSPLALVRAVELAEQALAEYAAPPQDVDTVSSA